MSVSTEGVADTSGTGAGARVDAGLVDVGFVAEDCLDARLDNALLPVLALGLGVDCRDAKWARLCKGFSVVVDEGDFTASEASEGAVFVVVLDLWASACNEESGFFPSAADEEEEASEASEEVAGFCIFCRSWAKLFVGDDDWRELDKLESEGIAFLWLLWSLMMTNKKDEHLE